MKLHLPYLEQAYSQSSNVATLDVIPPSPQAVALPSHVWIWLSSAVGIHVFPGAWQERGPDVVPGLAARPASEVFKEQVPLGA